METYYVLMLAGFGVFLFCAVCAYVAHQRAKGRLDSARATAMTIALFLMLLLLASGGLWSIIIGIGWMVYALVA